MIGKCRYNAKLWRVRVTTVVTVTYYWSLLNIYILTSFIPCIVMICLIPTTQRDIIQVNEHRTVMDQEQDSTFTFMIISCILINKLYIIYTNICTNRYCKFISNYWNNFIQIYSTYLCKRWYIINKIRRVLYNPTHALFTL